MPIAVLAQVPAHSGVPAAVPASPELVEQGRLLYMEGKRPDGAPLVAERLDAGPLAGPAAACVSCHRRSGLGGMEGDVIVPPINGPALYAGSRLRDRVIISMDPRRGRAFNPSHPPYDETSLLAAIRDGKHVTGRAMLALMPRYRVDPPEFAALKAYLDQLSAQWSPGVTERSIRFATVITPDVTPERKDAFLRTIQALFDQKFANTLPGHRHMISAAEGMLNLERNWDLDVWDLQGPPETWRAQLEERYRKAPVFALVSGLGGGEWGPVQEFSEREKVPCWFPSVIAPPPGAASQTYTLYFSNGVRLEADVLAAHLAAGAPSARARRVVQVLRDEPAARAAADELARSLRAAGAADWHIEQRLVGSAAWPSAQAALQGVRGEDVLALWLRPDDWKALHDAPRPPAPVYASALLARGEAAPFPAAWREGLHLVYPYQLPDKRQFNMATFRSWIANRQLPLADEAMQSEVFFSVGYLMYTLTDMLDNVYRDLLIDRGEAMVRRREMARAEEEIMIRLAGHPPAPQVAANARQMPGPIFDTNRLSPMAQANTPPVGKQEGTTIYPRLSLAPGQRFASKGAYIVRWSDGGLTAESDWITP